MSESDFDRIKQQVRQFVVERDWDQYHSPKNLSMALIVEAAELVEHFQWLTEEQSANLSPEKLAEVEQELADIQVHGAWSGPARLHLVPHVNAPVADLPVRSMLGGLHFIADLTLPYGRVIHDYLAT